MVKSLTAGESSSMSNEEGEFQFIYILNALICIYYIRVISLLLSFDSHSFGLFYILISGMVGR